MIRRIVILLTILFAQYCYVLIRIFFIQHIVGESIPLLTCIYLHKAEHCVQQLHRSLAIKKLELVFAMLEKQAIIHD